MGLAGWILIQRRRDAELAARFGSHERRIATLETGLPDARLESAVHDGKIREILGREFTPRAECATFRAELRDSEIRLFGKLEEVQRAQAEGGGEMTEFRRQLNARLDRLETMVKDTARAGGGKER